MLCFIGCFSYVLLESHTVFDLYYVQSLSVIEVPSLTKVVHGLFGWVFELVLFFNSFFGPVFVSLFLLLATVSSLHLLLIYDSLGILFFDFLLQSGLLPFAKEDLMIFLFEPFASLSLVIEIVVMFFMGFLQYF